MRTLGRVGGVALVLLALLAPEAIAAAKGEPGNVRSPPVRRYAASTDNSGRMDANNLDMFVTNHGSFGCDLSTSEPGLRYPKGTTKTALFAAGIWVGAQVNDTIRTCIAEYSQEYAPGPMYNGTFQVDQSAFKNYRLEANNTTSDDYLNWPSQPVPLGQGVPRGRLRLLPRPDRPGLPGCLRHARDDLLQQVHQRRGSDERVGGLSPHAGPPPRRLPAPRE